ncbi:condensation domain-containing protein [Micromonospora sp. LOL_014]|uniref:condensation domain-containing protein n=1 Tax=Micromonospora sp. LOL_014 TaxID=3345415 RepID=UPI003A8399DF
MSISELGAVPDGRVRQAPLSLNQEFLCMYDRGDQEGPFGPAYHIVHGWRVRGRIDVDLLRAALTDVVARHEALRSLVVRGEHGHQEIHPPAPPELEVRDLGAGAPQERDQRAEELLIQIEQDDFPVRVPLLRAVLGRFDADDAVLVLVSHHSATDGWSMRLIIREVAARYAVRGGHPVDDLDPPRQYAEFARWQRDLVADAGATRTQRAYWRGQLAGAEVFTIGTDRPRSAGVAQSTGVHRFLIEADVVDAALRVGKRTRSSPFMVFYAAFAVLAHRMSGDPDVVVPTFTPGRGGDLFANAVGSFFNFLPLRTDLTVCRTFRDVVGQVRDNCVDAYSNDFPQILAEAPALMMPAISDDRAPCVFQLFPFPFLMDGEKVGDLEYSEIRRRLVSQPFGSDVPDGALWTLNLDSAGDVIGSVSYKNNLFDADTIATMVREYREVLAEAVAVPDAPLPVRDARG